MTTALRSLLAVLCVSLFQPSSSSADTVSTLTLDILSFVTFGDVDQVFLPPGSTIEFRFGFPNRDGSVPFTIEPRGISIPRDVLPKGPGTLLYSMPTRATGLMHSSADGLQINFDLTIRVTSRENASFSYDYTVPFTTEVAEAIDFPQTIKLTHEGLREEENGWHVQLVGATMPERNAYRERGRALYAFISGTFDQIP